MEGGVHRGRRHKKALVGTILLLMCMFSSTLTSLRPSAEQVCPPGDYLSETGICCNKCSPGFKLAEQCRAGGQRSNCTHCPDGQYTDLMNHYHDCFSCRRCRVKKHEVQVSPCKQHQNTICRCEDGYYKFDIDSGTHQCLKCAKCRPDEKEKQTCTPERNTACECTENYYRVRGKCEPCKNCSTECKHLCSLPTLKVNTSLDPYEAPDRRKECHIHMIAGVTGAVVLVVLVGVIACMATKWPIKKKLLKSSKQPCDVLTDSSELVSVHSEGLSNNTSVKAPCPPCAVSE